MENANHGPDPESPPEEKPPAVMEKRPGLPARPNLAARHAKRLTLSFPIVPPPAGVRSEQSSPSVVASGTPTTTAMSSGLPSLDSVIPSSDELHEPSDLLTAIASQERKVLELREELQRAETELSGLKRQWVLNERQKKRTEVSHHAEAMKTMKPADALADDVYKTFETPNPSPTTMDPVSAQIRRSKELERRQSLRSTQHKANVSVSSNGRRVFAGSKHTRTLSLLSPEMGVVKTPFPMKDEADQEAGITRHPRSATLPSVERADVSRPAEQIDSLQGDAANEWRRSMPPPSRDALLRTGRQMASDFREGLWTFLEDIRQATVGEEAINRNDPRALHAPSGGPRRASSGQRSDRSATPSRNRDQTEALGRTDSSLSLSKEAAKKSGKITSPADVEASFWSEFGVDTPGQKSKTKEVDAKTPAGTKGPASSKQPDEADDWDSWDSPQHGKSHTPSSSRSTIDSKKDQSPSTQLSSPRTSASFGDRNMDGERRRSENIPWPALTKFTPSGLTRTASNLMDEWEKSLTSSIDGSQKGDSPRLAQQSDQDDWEAF
ncbi:Eukaryotic translation initiation factor 3 subunit A [Talaromyces islandicus]|uniref:Eukaryotic translation initiation factor 3 subunit A n=1 Tax=Talaromyces islandicus TaxID=28573 RepID=A0A0U1LW75_TALIS|nr:Eukaryotic translation initiation factor 3 subunit A [Talaromyces islandicus]